MRILTLMTAGLLAMPMAAQQQQKQQTVANSNREFKVVKQLPITSVKNQYRSGTCWDYGTLGYLESEILRKTGRTFDLCEMFVVNKDYMDNATHYVRMHGYSQISEGGSCDDVVEVIRRHGICPEEAMPAPGSLTGDSLANFNEFFSVLTPYIEAVGKNKAKKISRQWLVGYQGILDAYLGKCPEEFMYEGKKYTPKTFVQSLGINLDDYVSITSYTHHPFYTTFAVEVQDNWRFPLSYNLPMDEMMRVIDNAVAQGYTVAWGGDVSEEGFTRQGLAYAIDGEKAKSLSGSDMARWLKLTADKRKNVIDSLGCNVPEITPTQQLRQERFDNWELTDDHGMLIYGVAKDQNGKEYYMVKNSWGETGNYKGTWYMTKTFIAANTMDFLINKNAIPKDIRKKLGI